MTDILMTSNAFFNSPLEMQAMRDEVDALRARNHELEERARAAEQQCSKLQLAIDEVRVLCPSPTSGYTQISPKSWHLIASQEVRAMKFQAERWGMVHMAELLANLMKGQLKWSSGNPTITAAEQVASYLINAKEHQKRLCEITATLQADVASLAWNLPDDTVVQKVGSALTDLAENLSTYLVIDE